MAIVIFSIAGINSIISNQQELVDVNEEIIEKQLKKIQETTSISGAMTDDGVAMITNGGTNDMTLIQIRVYDDNGDFVKSFPMNQTISGNSKEFLNMTSELQAMMQG